MASGMATTAAARKPSSTVAPVHKVCVASAARFCARERNTGSGPGRRYSGVASTRTVTSQTTNTIANEPKVQASLPNCVRIGLIPDDPHVVEQAVDPPDRVNKGRAVARVEPARARQVDFYHLAHAAGPRRHDDDAIGQEHCLLDAVGDEDDGLF